jgi:hypothetical protein
MKQLGPAYVQRIWPRPPHLSYELFSRAQLQWHQCSQQVAVGGKTQFAAASQHNRLSCLKESDHLGICREQRLFNSKGSQESTSQNRTGAAIACMPPSPNTTTLTCHTKQHICCMAAGHTHTQYQTGKLSSSKAATLAVYSLSAASLSFFFFFFFFSVLFSPSAAPGDRSRFDFFSLFSPSCMGCDIYTQQQQQQQEQTLVSCDIIAGDRHLASRQKGMQPSHPC